MEIYIYIHIIYIYIHIHISICLHYISLFLFLHHSDPSELQKMLPLSSFLGEEQMKEVTSVNQ